MDDLKKQNDLLESQNKKEYIVKSWDTIWSIASRNWISDFYDLVYFNQEKWVDLNIIKKWKRVIIPLDVWQTIYLPTNMEEFYKNKEFLRKKQEYLKQSLLVAKWDRNALKKELNERIFPQEPISFWIKNTLLWFLKAQQISLDPQLPRVVDSKPLMETKATCSHFIKMLFSQSVNPKDLKPKEKKLLETKDIDAWIFPQKAMEIDFDQKFNAMGTFSPAKIPSWEPVSDEQGYVKILNDMWKYLQTSGVEWSLMPILYKYSSYKSKIVQYNSSQKEKHYNTHMSVFAWNNTISFLAWEVSEVKNWKIIPFTTDNTKIREILTKEQKKLDEVKPKLEASITALEWKLELSQFPELQKRASKIDERIETLFVSQERDDSKKEILRTEFKELLKSRNVDYILSEIKNLTKVKVTREDIVYLIALLKNQEQITKQFEIFQKTKPNPENFEILSYSDILPTSLIWEYNSTKKEFQELNEEFERLKQELLRWDLTKIEREDLWKMFAWITPRKIAWEKSLEKLKNDLIKQINKNDVLEKSQKELSKKVQEVSAGSSRKSLEIYYALAKNQQIKWISGEDFNQIKKLFDKTNSIEKRVNQAKTELWINSWELEVFDISYFPKDHPLYQTLQEYNANVSQMKSSKVSVEALTKALETKREISVVDFLVNFIQQRADLSQRYISQDFKKEVEDGLVKYWDLVNFKLNWKEINISEELKKPKYERIQINPEDNFEISWPMMVDGVHMVNAPEEDRRQKMNARTRFFFELVATWVFFPTELLEPNEKSSFRNMKLSDVAEKLPTKWSYDLRRWDTLEKVLKNRIPIFEKEAFAWLTPGTKAYNDKIQYYYALQIKALQLSWFIENENKLNPSATNINRIINYYNPDNITNVYNEYIQKVKTQILQRNADMAEVRDFIDVQIFPWDTNWTLFARIKEYLQPYISKNKDLEKINSLNSFTQLVFLKKVLEKSILWDKSLTIDKLMKNDFKAWTKFIIKIEEIESILKEVNSVSFSLDYEWRIRPLDEQIIELVAKNKQSWNLMKTAMLIESYKVEWSVWRRSTTKAFLEEYPLLQNLKPINSYWDFQIRVWILEAWFSQEWPKKEHLEKVFKTFEDPKIIKLLTQESEKNPLTKKVIQEDLFILARCKEIFSKKELTKEDFRQLEDLFKKLLRIDVASVTWHDSIMESAKTVILNLVWIEQRYWWTNIVGKILWASLLDDKISNHFEKTVWFLSAAHQDIPDIFSNKEKMESLEKMVLLTNNLSENKVVFWLAENFLIRLVEWTKILDNAWIPFTIPQIQLSMSWSMTYYIDTFIHHVESIQNLINSPKQWEKFQLLANNPWSSLQDLSKSWELQENTNMLKVVWLINGFCNEILQAKNSKNKTWDVLKAIYEFVGNKELKDLLANTSFDKTNPTKRISTDFLPTQEEFRGNSFRNIFFNYPNKVLKVRKQKEV